MKVNKKLIKKFMGDRMHITVEDCDGLLTSYGYVYRKSSGSHRAYHKKGERPIIVITPKNTKYLKPEYVKQIIKRLGLEE